MGLNKILHHLLPICADEIRGLRREYLDSGTAFDRVHKTLVAVAGDGRACRTLQDDHTSIPASVLDHPLPDPLPFFYEIGTDEGNEILARRPGGFPVQQEYRD